MITPSNRVKLTVCTSKKLPTKLSLMSPENRAEPVMTAKIRPKAMSGVDILKVRAPSRNIASENTAIATPKAISTNKILV